MSVVTIEDVKAHLNVLISEDDDLLTNKIAAAEEWIGLFIGTPLADLTPTPETLREAVRMLVGHLYENREASIVAVSAELMPLGLYDLMAPYRQWSF